MANHSTAFINNKYRNKAADEHYAELEKQLYGEREEPKPIENNLALVEDKTDWKKRYSDLQSYMASKEADWKREKEDFNKRVKALETSATMPASITEDELKDWEYKYPAVARVIEHKARVMAEQIAGNLQEKISSMEENSRFVEQQKAYIRLLELHPDWDTLKDSQEWANWIVEQDIDDQKSINEPADFSERSVQKAAKIIKLFKLETNVVRREEPRQRDTSAAESVTRNRAEMPDDLGTAPRFTESQIERECQKDPRWFERNMKDILEAQRKGEPYFIRDLSAATAVGRRR